MSQDETQREVRTGTALSALSLAGIGLSLLVAPKEVAGALLLLKKRGTRLCMTRAKRN